LYGFGPVATETKELILDAAEALIAERGIDAVSLRAITSAAKVNLAAVHYHFGSKEALVRHVFERRIGPVNVRRLELLDQAGDENVEIEAILRAFIGPSIRLYAQDPKGRMFMRVCGRIFNDPSPHLQQSLDEFFTDIVARFSAAFQRALPQLEPHEVAWRMHFMVGVMIHTLMGHDRLRRFTNGACTIADPEATIDRMVTFCAAGMRAPRARIQETAEPALMNTPL
jgi:AcrR family transcriptional regulator